MRGLTLSEDEIAARLPLWVAMSDLFLDTEPGDQTYARIANVIGHSTFSPDEAETIFRQEVAPSFAANLINVAGEWQGWDEEFVSARVLSHARSLSGKIAILIHGKRSIDEKWSKIREHL